MINIISKSNNRLMTSGPKKVVDNLIKGLQLIGYPYVINRQLDACARLWIHDDVEALWHIKDLPSEIKVVIGPNLFVKPAQIPKNLNLSRAVYLQPSRWTDDFWKAFGFTSCPTEVWPAGIDTNEFVFSSLAKKYILIYFKQRSQVELEFIKKELQSRKLEYKVITYPKYSEKEYKKLLAEARYCIWLGRHESQGIALEEALSCNVPMVVCDINHIGDWTAPIKEMAQFTEKENKFIATSAEYFDVSCGVKINQLTEFSSALDSMEKRLMQFRPREYILQNLSLEKQAKDLIDIYHKHYNLTYEQGLTEKVLRLGKWKNDAFRFKMYGLIKDGVKTVLRAAR